MATKSVKKRIAALNKKQAKLQVSIGGVATRTGRLAAKVSRKEGRAKVISNKGALKAGRIAAKSLISGAKNTTQGKRRLKAAKSKK